MIRHAPLRQVSAVLLAAASTGTLHAQSRPEYTIHRAGSAILIDGRLDEPAWIAAPDVGRFQFAWHESGKMERTVAKLLWDHTHLYLGFICEDAHIWAIHTERDSRVWLDDTVEMFTAPDPERPDTYFNIEMNVLGIFLDQFHPAGPGSRVEPDWNAEGIRIRTTWVGTLNDDTDEDSHWVLEAAIPFHNFAEVARSTPPRPGDVWHMNLNRLGGNTNAQYSQWSPGRTPRPNFHVPGDFGRVTFSDRESPFWR